MKILIVEDDAKTASYLQKGFVENGCSVDVCHDGAEGFQAACAHPYDFYIFDVMMPEMNGFDLLRKLRGLGHKAHAVFLTAKDQLHDRVEGLELGADAYLVKPFSFSELLAVVRSMYRRVVTSNQSAVTTNPMLLEIADLSIDLNAHNATRQGQKLDLTPLEFRLLVFLARRVGEVVSRTVIMEQVWDINFDCNTNVVDVHIRRLRAKLDDPFDKPLIHTIRGVGYAFKVDV